MSKFKWGSKGMKELIKVRKGVQDVLWPRTESPLHNAIQCTYLGQAWTAPLTAIWPTGKTLSTVRQLQDAGRAASASY